MAKKTSFKWHTQSGEPINVYGELSSDGQSVHTWTKNQLTGIFRIERFGSAGLTSKTLQHVMTVGDLS